MACARHGAGAPEYQYCSYPGVDLDFRGPQRALDQPYLTFLGGTALFGAFVQNTIPDLVETATGLACVNLGQMNAGVDLMNLPAFTAIADQGIATVIEVVGAQNQSNSFYRVHPRRNDRVISPTPLFRRVFPRLDLTEVHFTRHLLTLIKARAPDHFDTVVEDLRASWVQGMTQLLQRVPGPKLLLWIVPAPVARVGASWAVRDPLFIDQAAIRSVAPYADGIVEIRETPAMAARGVTEMCVPDPYPDMLPAVPRGALLRDAALDLLDPLEALGIGTGQRRLHPEIRQLA